MPPDDCHGLCCNLEMYGYHLDDAMIRLIPLRFLANGDDEGGVGEYFELFSPCIRDYPHFDLH